MTTPLIVTVGSPRWLAALVPQAQAAKCRLEHWPELGGYVTRLVDAQAALILIDSADPDWRFWTSTPKASPATRRIPIIVTAETGDLRRAALIAGADMALTPAELLSTFDSLVRDYARVPDPARLEQLACECQGTLPPLAQEGIRKFNAGEYYKQHDLFEALWVQTEGPVRDLYRAILQVGVAYYQIERGNHRGALKMLLRSVQWLLALPDVCQGVDVRQLRADSFRVRAELEALTPETIDQFDRRLLRPVRLLADDQPV
jgi:predicted metal-dependent hydrolase